MRHAVWGTAVGSRALRRLAVVLVTAAGCAPGGHPGAAVALLQVHFPAHADRVLGGGGGAALVAAADGGGFGLAPSAGADPVTAAEAALAARGGLRARFPATGEGAVHMSLPGGFGIDVREVGLGGTGRIVRGAVVYERGPAEGVFWSATTAGYEEWLLVRVGAGGAIAAWNVEGGVLRAQGDAVAIVDATGRARLRVTAPAAYTASGAPVRVRLRAEGARLALTLEGAADAGLVLVDPSWQATGTLGTARSEHSATLLPSEKVLVAGGSDSAGPLASAELYDPVAGTFTPTAGPLATARQTHTATLLPSGKVLVAGGYDGTSYLASAELFDPAAGTFAPAAGSLATARYSHTATLLPSEKVLVAGGWGSAGSLASAELYDPVAGTFAPTIGPLATARQLHVAALLPAGKVLVAGGQAGAVALASAELYDPAAATFAPAAGPLAKGRWNSTATLLASGKVLVAGGIGGGSSYLASAELYDPASGNFAPTAGSLVAARAYHTATLLPSGQVLMTGGHGTAGYLASAELYDPIAATFALTTGGLATARSSHTATLLPLGMVLIAGGYNGTAAYLASAELFDLSAVSPCATDASCAAVTGYYCTAGGRCNARKVQGAACNPATDCRAPDCSECLSGNCAAGWCCDTACAGTCSACDGATRGWPGAVNGTCAMAPAGSSGQPSCAPYVCDGLRATCASPCAKDAHCASGSYCAATGACLPQKSQGAACDPPSDCRAAPCRACATGYCVDGRCCDTACSGGGCDVCGRSLGAAADGTCTVAPAGLVGHCSLFVCDGTSAACPTSCTSNSDCATSAFCDLSQSPGVCKSDQPLGQPCLAGGDCASGSCADGVCCNETCAGNCRVCDLPASLGTCVTVPDGEDPRRACQASSGGATACAGTCQSGQCAFPDVGTMCGLCSACDGTGRCTLMPPDDSACGAIACSGLSTPCRAYHDLTSDRCEALGECKAQNAPATCTDYTDLACDGGGPEPHQDAGPQPGGDAAPRPDGGAPPGQDAGSGSTKSGGCAAAPQSPAGAGALVTLLLGASLAQCRRRRRRPPT